LGRAQTGCAIDAGEKLPNRESRVFVCGFTSAQPSMKHYDFTAKFHALYNQAVTRYAAGRRGADVMFGPDEVEFLAANGISVQHLYDYAEDHNNYSGQPGADIALAIELVRRDYFLNVQNGCPSTTVIDDSSLPSKTDTVRDIAWLPRLLIKARAKLRGELPASLMFCCGGDRKFFQEHDILPSEFLTLVWRSETNDAAIVDWVVKRSAAK
jgi:hypothetical protein